MEISVLCFKKNAFLPKLHLFEYLNLNLNKNLEYCMNFELQCIVLNPNQVTNELVYEKAHKEVG